MADMYVSDCPESYAACRCHCVSIFIVVLFNSPVTEGLLILSLTVALFINFMEQLFSGVFIVSFTCSVELLL